MKNYLKELRDLFLTHGTWWKKWKGFVTVMAMVVVFVTTYALILPAITLEKDEGKPEQGVYLENVERGSTASLNKDSTADPSETSSEEDLALPEDESDVAIAPLTEGDDAAASDEKTDDDDQSVENQSADNQSVDNQKTAYAEGVYSAKGDGYTVFLDLKEEMKLPEDIRVTVEDITEDQTKPAVYRAYTTAVARAAKREGRGEVSSVRIFKVALFSGDKEIRTREDIDVLVVPRPGDKIKNGEEAHALAFRGSAAYMIDDLATEINGHRVSAYRFVYPSTAGNSNWGLMAVAVTAPKAEDENNEASTELVPDEEKPASTEATEEVAASTEKTASTEATVEVAASTEATEEVAASTETEAATETKEDNRKPAEKLTYQGEDYKVVMTCDENSGIPEDAELQVTEIAEGSKAYKKYLKEARETLDMNKKADPKARFFDIKIMDGDKEIEPKTPVSVKISYDQPMEVKDGDKVDALHFGEKKTEVIEDLKVKTNKNDDIKSVTFDAESFSVYGVVTYTVDFEYEINGKIYRFSMQGGESESIRKIIQALGIVENQDEASEFVKDIADVTFSNPELVNVVHKTKVLGVFGSEDWVLESLKAFTSEETLLITMNDGAQFAIKVTDAQYTTDLNSLQTGISVTINGEELKNGDKITVDKGDKFNLHLDIAENDFFQFPDDGTEMVYQLPAGITLDSATTYITINMGIDGKVYRNKLVYDPVSNTLKLTWNTKDPKFDTLTSNDNTKISLDLSGSFNEDATHVDFSGDLGVDVEHAEHHDANIEKSGQIYMAGESGNPYGNQPAIKYTVTVTSDGTTTVNVNDVVEGSAVTLDTTNWTATSNKGTTITPTFTGKGFSLNNQSLQDGEVVTITYWGKVDTSKINNVTNVSYSETGNKVTLTGDSFPDKEATHYEHQVGTRNVSKVSTGVENTGDNEQTASWTIKVNENPTSSIGGSTITDSISDNSKAVMSYDTSTKPYLTVRDASGNIVSSRSGPLEWSALGVTNPSTQKTWTYNIPQNDGAYSYEITYKTIVDTSSMSGPTSVSNNVETQNGSSTGTANVGPKPEDQKYTITKNKVSVDEEKTTWSITVTAEPGQYNSFVITDIFPTKDYYGRFFVDGYEVDSAKIVGLEGDEWADIVTYQDYMNKQEAIKAGDNEQINKVEFVFYKDGKNSSDKSHPGLDATSQRTFTIELTSINSKAWIEEAKKGEDEGTLSHNNTALVNNVSSSKSVEPMSKTVYKYRKQGAPQKPVLGPDEYTDSARSGGVSYPMYTFRIIAGGVDEDTVVIEDNFNTDLFKVYVPNPMDRNKAPQFWGGNGDPKYAHNEEIANYDDFTFVESDGKVTFTATNIPKDDAAYYSFYMVEYNLIPKSEEAWNTIKQMALENGGEYIFTNTAKYDDSEAEIDFKYNYNVIDKSSVAEGDENLTLLKYTIKINQDKLKLNNGEMMTLTDTYSTNLSVDFGSISVTAVDKNGNDRSSEVTWDYRGHVGTFTIPDETYVELKYNARAVGDPGSVQTVSNTAYMEGYSDTETKNQVVDIAGDGSSERVRIRLLKFAADHMEGGLDKAVFRLLDQDMHPIIDKNGEEVTFTTGTGYLNKYGVIHAAADKLDYVDKGTGDEASYDTGVYRTDLNESGQAKWDSGAIANPTSDADKIVTYEDLSKEGRERLGISLHSGFAEIYMNQKEQGYALKKERVYYLEEIKTPVGENGEQYEKTNVKYSFLITDQADYSAPGGIYVYHNNDIMTVRNWETEKASLKISKTFTGNVELTDAQKNQVTFTVKKKNDQGEFVDFPIDVYNSETGQVEKKATFTYGDVKDVDGTPLFVDGVLTIDDIEAGEYQVLESNIEIDGSQTIHYRTEYLVDGEKQTATDSGVSVTITDKDIQDKVVHDVAVTNSYFTNKYQIVKYASDTAQVLGGAKFKLVRVDANGTETTVKENLETNNEGKLDLQWTNNTWDSSFTFEKEKLYYVVETDAPTGFVLPESPEKEYFYFSSDPTTSETSTWKPGGELPAGESAVDISTGYGSANVPNKRDSSKTYISVDKKWVNSLGRDITSTMTDAEAVNVHLYRTTDKPSQGTVITDGDTDNAKDASELKTLTIKKGNTDINKLYFLPGDQVQIAVVGEGFDDNTKLNFNYNDQQATVSTEKRRTWVLTMSNSDATATLSGIDRATSISPVNITAANRVFVLTKSQAESVKKDSSFDEETTLNASNEWTHTFTDLEVTNNTGQTYFYYLVEDEATKDTTYDVGSKSITVTNKAPDQLEVNKKWEDSKGNNINDQKTDGSITYELYQVENPLSVGPYTGTGEYNVNINGLNTDGEWNHVKPSLTGHTDKIKAGSKITFTIEANSASNQNLTGEVTVTGANDISDINEEVPVDQGGWSANYHKRTIIVDNVTSDITISGIIETNTILDLKSNVDEEPTEASTDWDDLTKNKMGTIVVTHDNATLTKEASFDDDNFRVTPGSKAWSSLVYNLPSSGTKDGKTVNYTYYVVETAANGFTPPSPLPAYQVNGETVTNANGLPGDTIVIVNKQENGSVKVTKNFAGIDQNQLPTDFKVTAVWTEGTEEKSVELTPSGTQPENVTLTGTWPDYTWTINEIPIGTEVTFTETGYDVAGYDVVVTGSATADDKTTATATAAKDTPGEASFTNTYEKKVKDFEFTKEWHDADDKKVDTWKTGTTIKVNVYRFLQSDKTVKEQIGTYEITKTETGFNISSGEGAPELINKQGTFTFQLKALDAYGEINGKAGDLDYYALEETVEGYKDPVYTNINPETGAKTTGTEALDKGTIINRPVDAYELPSTGGLGTRMFTILGSVLILAAGVLLLRRRLAVKGGGDLL